MNYLGDAIALVIFGILALLIFGPPSLPLYKPEPPRKRETKEMSIKEIWEEDFKDAA